MKKILIIGKDSYIGESFYKWMQGFPEKYIVDIVLPLNYEWKKCDFSQYQIVVNFAGVAHINNITADMEEMFYSVNRDLVIEIGNHAKQNGVKHFVHFSSMNVYGDYCDNITDRSKTNPTSFYGDSKLQGDLGLFKLQDKDFIVSSLRPPFVYGKGCRGNYNTISKIAKKTPIFPKFNNKKSMIYIDNLCEFVRLVIDNEVGGVFTPQNKELVSTAQLVEEIAVVNGKKVLQIKLFNPFIKIGKKLTRIIRKAFADDCYCLKLSNYYNFEYCVVDFKESIVRTEK